MPVFEPPPDEWVQCSLCPRYTQVRWPYERKYCKACRTARRAFNAYANRVGAAAKRFYRNVKKGII